MNEFCIAFAQVSDNVSYETTQVVSISLVPVVKGEISWPNLLHIPAIRPSFGATFSQCGIPSDKLVNGIDTTVACSAVREFYKKFICGPIVLNDVHMNIAAVRKLFYALGQDPYRSDNMQLNHVFLDYNSIIAGNQGTIGQRPLSLINMTAQLIPIFKLTEKKA